MSKGGGGASETPYDKELASIAADRQANYEKTFVPLERYVAAKTLNAQPQYQQEALGTSNANYQQQFGLNQPSVVAAEGQRQNGGNLAPALGNYSVNRGLATGLGAVDTQLGSQRTQTGNLQGLIDIGQGKASNAINSLSSVANTAQQQAIIDARASAAASNAIRQGIGTAAGLGVGFASGPKIEPQTSTPAFSPSTGLTQYGENILRGYNSRPGYGTI